MKETTAYKGAEDKPELRVRDSTAAAAAWLDMARYSDTVGISQRYTLIYVRGGLSASGWPHLCM